MSSETTTHVALCEVAEAVEEKVERLLEALVLGMADRRLPDLPLGAVAKLRAIDGQLGELLALLPAAGAKEG